MVMDASESTIKAGSIMLWYGSVASIPGGWTLCDGTNNTPNLRDRFIVGAGNTYAVGATGGSLTHDHLFTGAGHSHTMEAGGQISAGTDISGTTGIDTAAGETGEASNLPPYYALCYIMKL